MVSCSADESGQILTISYSRDVTSQEVCACLAKIRDGMAHLQPGFVLLSDLTSLESMDPSCAESVGGLMELLSAKGMTAVIRVIPDPAKDIGFNIISLFHYEKPLRSITQPNLAEAVKFLVNELPSLRPVA